LAAPVFASAAPPRLPASALAAAPAFQPASIDAAAGLQFAQQFKPATVGNFLALL
jgi:hypothetical protein